MIPMVNPLGDSVIVVPRIGAWLDQAIKSLPEYTRNRSEPLDAWIISPSAHQLFSDAVEKVAGHDEPWCDDCIAWIENNNESLCQVWSDEFDLIEECGFKIAGIDEEEKPMANTPTFRIPESVKKLFSDPNTDAHKFLKKQAKEGIKKAVSAMGIPVESSVIDEVFEAFYAAAYHDFQEWRPKGDSTLSPQQAASVLGCSWPATKEELVAAFRKKVLDTHPDRPGGSKEAFVKIGLAREVLVAAGYM
jgi:hypothetical protein